METSVVPLLVIAVMLAAGVAGGFVNYVTDSADSESKLAWWKHACIATVATFMVPLFLNTIASGLLDQILGKAGQSGQAPDLSKLFVFAGFCLVAAVSSRTFIKTLSDKVLAEAKSAGVKAEKAVAQADEAAKKADAANTKAQAADTKADAATSSAQQAGEVAHEAVAVSQVLADQVAEPDEEIAPAEASDGAQAEALALAPELSLSEDEQRTLRAFQDGNYALRSLSGIAKQTELDRGTVNKVISALIDKGLVNQVPGRSGQPRWALTRFGRLHAKRA